MRIVDPVTGDSYFEKRRRRYNEASQPRELTFSCFRRIAFFSRERTCEWFIQALDKARARFGFQVWAYVIMPDHVHLLIHPRGAAGEVPRFLQAVKEPVARQAMAYLKANAPDWLERLTVHEGRRVRHRFWQPGGGYDRNIASSETIRVMIEYIHAKRGSPRACRESRRLALVECSLVCGPAASEDRDGRAGAYRACSRMRAFSQFSTPFGVPQGVPPNLRACHPGRRLSWRR